MAKGHCTFHTVKGARVLRGRSRRPMASETKSETKSESVAVEWRGTVTELRAAAPQLGEGTTVVVVRDSCACRALDLCSD